jgi:serine/threonine protein kinase
VVLKKTEFNLRIYENERAILARIDHHFIAKMYDTDKVGCLTLEYCPGGDLFNLISNSKAGRFSRKNVQFYGACIMLALEYLN